MEQMIVWLFLVVLEGEGGHGEAFPDKEACDKKRVEMMADPLLLGISRCIPMQLEMKLKQEPKARG